MLKVERWVPVGTAVLHVTRYDGSLESVLEIQKWLNSLDSRYRSVQYESWINGRVTFEMMLDSPYCYEIREYADPGTYIVYDESSGTIDVFGPDFLDQDFKRIEDVQRS